MSSNKALGYYDDREAPFVDWDWASPAIQAYSHTERSSQGLKTSSFIILIWLLFVKF